MSKELEEAKLQVKEIISHKNDFDYAFGTKIQRPFTVSHEGLEAIETVLNYIENFVSKDKIKEILEESNREENSEAYRYDELYSNLYYEIQKLLEEE